MEYTALLSSSSSLEHTFISEKTYALLLNFSLRKVFCTSLMCLWLLTMPFLPAIFWCCLQIVPKEVRFQLNEAPTGTAWITSCPWGKTKSWLICASLARSKEVLLQSPLQEDRLHSFTVLKILKKGTIFKVDSKSCCSCCYRFWLQSRHRALCCRITVYSSMPNTWTSSAKSQNIREK